MVVDIETTGLDPDVDAVVAAGIVTGDRLIVLVSDNGDIRDHIADIIHNGYYAWNKDFEESFLGVPGLELQIEPYEKKDLSLRWGIPIPTDGSMVPSLWEMGRRDLVALRAAYDALIEASSLLRIVYLRNVEPELKSELGEINGRLS